MLLKLSELILPSFHLSGLRGGLILRTSLQRKKIHINMLCYTQMSYTGILHSAYSVSGTCR